MSAEAKKIQFELVSPEEKLIEQPVYMVAMPSENGEIGVGRDHTSLVSALKAGTVKLYENSLKDTPRRVYISGGFVDIAGDTCSLLAEEAVSIEDLPPAEELEKEILQMEEDLKLAEGQADHNRFSQKIHEHRAKLNAVTSK